MARGRKKSPERAARDFFSDDPREQRYTKKTVAEKTRDSMAAAMERMIQKQRREGSEG